MSANYFGKCILFTCSEEALRLGCLNRKFGSNKMRLLQTPRQIITEANTFKNSNKKKGHWLAMRTKFSVNLHN